MTSSAKRPCGLLASRRSIGSTSGWPAVHRCDSATGAIRTWSMPELVGCLAMCANGDLLVGLRSSIRRFNTATENLAIVAAPESGNPQMRLNDGRCDRRGRFWVGSMNDVTRGPEGTCTGWRAPARACRSSGRSSSRTASRGVRTTVRCISPDRNGARFRVRLRARVGRDEQSPSRSRSTRHPRSRRRDRRCRRMLVVCRI